MTQSEWLEKQNKTKQGWKFRFRYFSSHCFALLIAFRTRLNDFSPWMDKWASRLNKGKASVSCTGRIFLGKMAKRRMPRDRHRWEIVAIPSLLHLVLFLWFSFCFTDVVSFLTKFSYKEKRFGGNRPPVSRQSSGKEKI